MKLLFERQVMSQVKQLGAELSSKLAEMEAICKEHGYEVTPTLLLRHNNGPTFSMLLSNDDLNKVVLCIEPLNEESIERVLDAWREKLRREIPNNAGYFVFGYDA